MLLASAVSTSLAVILAVQALVFAIGALRGCQHPYGRLFGAFLAPRLGPSPSGKPVQPLRFANSSDLIFAAVGLVGFVAGPRFWA